MKTFDPEFDGFVADGDAENIIVSKTGINVHSALTIIRRWTQNSKFDYFSFIAALH